MLTDGEQVTLTANFAMGATNANSPDANQTLTATATAHVTGGQAQPINATFSLPHTTWTPTLGQPVTIWQGDLTIHATVTIQRKQGGPETDEVGHVSGCSISGLPPTQPPNATPFVTIPAGGTANTASLTNICTASFQPAIVSSQPTTDIRWRVATTSSPSSHAGRAIKTYSTAASGEIPAAVLQPAVTAGHWSDGQQISFTVSLTLTGTNSDEGAQTLNGSGAAKLSVVNGQAQPLDETVTLPNTIWHPTDATQPVTIREQAAVIVLSNLSQSVTFRCTPFHPQPPVVSVPAGNGTHITLGWDANDLPAERVTANYGNKTDVISDLHTSYYPDGSLAEQTNTAPAGSSDIRYFNALVETSADNNRPRNLIKNYNFDGHTIARTDNTGTHYVHNDQDGSPAVLTNRTGTAAATISYTPWGASTSTGATLDGAPNYTGAQRLAGSDILQLGARLYNPTLGRFLSPDSLDPAGSSTQSTNGYSYTENDPVNFTDPSGHQDDSGGTITQDAEGSNALGPVGSFVAVGIWAYENRSAIWNALGSAWNWTTNAANSAGNWLKGAGNDVGNFFGAVGNFFGGLFSSGPSAQDLANAQASQEAEAKTADPNSSSTSTQNSSAATVNIAPGAPLTTSATTYAPIAGTPPANQMDAGTPAADYPCDPAASAGCAAIRAVYDQSSWHLSELFFIAQLPTLLIPGVGEEELLVDAEVLQARAAELQALRERPWLVRNGTTSAISARNAATGEIRTFIATEAEGMPSSWEGLLNPNETFVEGSGHAEETILRNLGSDWTPLAGGTSRNVCSVVCSPLIEGSGGQLGGPEFPWNPGSGLPKTPFRMFWW
jgi:RHS repeat-associated protein